MDECIEAASFEYIPETQKRLMRASSFGKSFLEFYPASKHVEMNKALRILNSVRDPKVGIPLTYEQYQALGSGAFLQILCNRGHFGLAKGICEYLRLPMEQVLISWASHQVRCSTLDNDALSRLINDKFSEHPGISYSHVANEAFKNGRLKLATSLLDFEPYPADQVPILLSMGQDELALKKSIDSKDAELIYLCIFQMKSKLTIPDLFQIIHDKPIACNLLKVYAIARDPQMLKDYYYQDDKPGEIAKLDLIAALEEKV